MMTPGLAALLLYAGVGRPCTLCEGGCTVGHVQVRELAHGLKLVHICYHRCPLCEGSGLQPAGRKDASDYGEAR